jgi:hypothetical protein
VETKLSPACPWEHASEVLQRWTAGKGGSGRNPRRGQTLRARDFERGRGTAAGDEHGGPAERLGHARTLDVRRRRRGWWRTGTAGSVEH